MQKGVFYLLLLFCFSACNQFGNTSNKKKTGSARKQDCRAQPRFMQKYNLDPSRTALSTSEKQVKGLAMVEFSTDPNIPNKIIQDSSWTKAGYLGPLLFDNRGNCYVAPVPRVNILDNLPEAQNILYKVTSEVGIMEKFIELPTEFKPDNQQNPFGIMGLDFDCDNSIIYVSSLMGSTTQNEHGIIYAISSTSKQIIDTYQNVDALGIGINKINDQKRIFYGAARTSQIWSVAIDENGKFDKESKLEIDFSGLGANGDDRARKIRFSSENGYMIFNTVSFYYNLVAPSEKVESEFTYYYSKKEDKWVFKSIR